MFTPAVSIWLRSIAEQLKAGLEVKAEQYDNVTIFYSDIDEFSNITSASSPIQVRKTSLWDETNLAIDNDFVSEFKYDNPQPAIIYTAWQHLL